MKKIGASMRVDKEKFIQISEEIEGGKELAVSIFNDLRERFGSVSEDSINIAAFKNEVIDTIDQNQDMRWLGPLLFVRKVEKKLHLLEG